MKQSYLETIYTHSRLPEIKINYWCNDAWKERKDSDIETQQSLEKLARKHKGVGQLTIYDTMLWLGHPPTKLHLHSGTLVGYKNYCEYIGWTFDSTKKQLEYSDLPPNCNGVSFENLEDWFCIYKYNMKLLHETILKNKSVKQKCKIGC